MDNTTGNNQADRYLVNKVLSGDAQAFGEIIKNTQGLVAQVVFKLIPHAEDRKDIAQDIYLKAFQHLPGFKFQSKLSTWIARIAYNTCMNWLEKKKLLFPGLSHNGHEQGEQALEFLNRQSMEVSGNETEAMLSRKEITEILGSAIDALPPLYKTLVVLYHQEEQSYEELAQITALPAGTVKSYLYRARKMLKENLLSNYKKEEL